MTGAAEGPYILTNMRRILKLFSSTSSYIKSQISKIDMGKFNEARQGLAEIPVNRWTNLIVKPTALLMSTQHLRTDHAWHINYNIGK